MAHTISQQVTFIGVRCPGEVEEDPYVGRRESYTAAVRSQQRDVSEKWKNDETSHFSSRSCVRKQYY